MRRLLICLALGVSLAGVGGAQAQQAVTVNGVDATQVVIAPPDSPLGQIIKDRLNAAYYGKAPGAKGYSEAQELYYFYGARHFDPIWLKTSGDGSVSFSPAADKIIDVFKGAAAEGFNPADYLTPDIDVSAAGKDPDKLASLEAAFSAATLHYAHDAYMGRIEPQDVSIDFDPESKTLDAADLLTKLAASDSPDQILLALDPQSKEFAALKTALAKFDDTAETPPPPTVPAGALLKPGMTDPRVAVLRQRLSVPTPAMDDTNVYDDTLVAAVKDFQTQAGETADGIVGKATLAAMNKVASRISRDDIIANMERWRWLPHDLGDFHVMVNIPEFRVAVVDNDATTFSTRVVVGKPSTPTPSFSNSIKNIVVNPYWNVPPSIVAKEIAPSMLRNPGYLAGQNMQIVSGSHVIDASAIDWSGITQGNWKYSIRQLPGGGNALGRIKFLFPNAHNVYLHDTPSKSLFGNAVRAYSHGCVRVQNPMDFANALLQNEPGLTESDLEAMFGNTERWVNLKNHIPVHIAYFTVRADADGTLHAYADIYGNNKRLKDMLAGKAVAPEANQQPIVSGV